MRIESDRIEYLGCDRNACRFRNDFNKKSFYRLNDHKNLHWQLRLG